MIEQIKLYQQEYLTLIKEFITKERNYNEYLMLSDKIEILLKKHKKTITNFLELNKNYVYYGGATYFTQDSREIIPISFSNKKLIIADPIIKMNIYVKNSYVFNFDRIKEIVDRAINNTIKLEKEMINAEIIYINPFDFISEIKNDIFEMAQTLTLQYLNKNLKLDYKSLEELIEVNKNYSFEELEQRFLKLSQYFITVNSDVEDSLRTKIETNYKDCGISLDTINQYSAIEQIVNALIGLFGQAFELKSISLILSVPLYITRPNVLLYLNFINCVDELDNKNLKETNILFALYQVLKKYNFTEDNECLIKTFGEGKFYNDLLEKLIKKDFFINKYIEYIKRYIERNNIINFEE